MESTETQKPAASKNNVLEGFRWENISIRFKVQLALFIVANIAIFTIGALGYISATNALEKVTFDQLRSVRETKRQAITDYFDQLRKQVITLSESRMTVDAMQNFKNASLFLENDFYGDVPPDSMLVSLNDYYAGEFLPAWQKISNDTTATVEEFMIDNSASLKLQFYYISGNPYPTGSKDLLEKSNDGSLYSDVHARYHSIYRNYLKEFDIYDIFLIEPESGRIIYSVFKEVDYMTSLKDGPYRDSNIAEVFRKAAESPFKNFVALTDFEKYPPSYDAPAAFIASPIFDKQEKIGVLAFQISPNAIRNIITGNQQWEVEGLGVTGETYLIGSDFKMRSDARMLIENPDGFFETIEKMYTPKEVELIRRHNTSLLFQPVETEAARLALQGVTGVEIIENYRGTRSLSAFSDLDIEGVDWAIVSEIEEEEAFSLIYTLQRNIFLAMVVIFVVTSLLGYFYSRWFVKPIKKLRNTLMELSEGKSVKRLNVFGTDEIGQTTFAMNHLIDRIDKAAKFAEAIGQGQFDSSFKAIGEEDQLGKSLTEMRDQLKSVADDDRKRNWTTEGMAQFSDILRKHNHDLASLTDQALHFLMNYVGLAQGAVYLIERENGQKEWLEMKACYAYERKKHMNLQIEWGQGVVSQCWQDRDSIYMNDIPSEYPAIRTGLMKMIPKAILLEPIMMNEVIYGVIEVASLEEIPLYRREFIQKVTINLASSIASALNALNTQSLLRESQQLTQPPKPKMERNVSSQNSTSVSTE